MLSRRLFIGGLLATTGTISVGLPDGNGHWVWHDKSVEHDIKRYGDYYLLEVDVDIWSEWVPD